MKIYLARHGQANSTSIDPEASLSNQGKLETEAIANLLKHFSLDINTICYSEKKRSQQTAEILAQALNKPTRFHPQLNPSAPLKPLFESLEDNTLYIGHLPNIENLVLSLLSSPLPMISFVPTTILCLESLDGQWVIQWLISPEIIT